MIGVLTALWLSKPLRWALAGLIMFGAYEGWKGHQRSIGAQRERAEQEKATDNAIALGNAGVNKPAGRVRKLDPSTRAE